jgi:hypothetical protein
MKYLRLRVAEKPVVREPKADDEEEASRLLPRHLYRQIQMQCAEMGDKR